MSSDIDVNDSLWVTVRARILEVNVEVDFDPECPSSVATVPLNKRDIEKAN